MSDEVRITTHVPNTVGTFAQEAASEYFLPYEGRKSFYFISYAHKNSALVVPVIRELHERRYRLWYDEGIPAGSDWPANIALHMSLAAAVIFFVSKHSIASMNCLNEIKAASSNNKPILLLRLDDTELPESWQKLLRDAKYAKPGDTVKETADNILTSPFADSSAFLGDGKNDPGGVSGSRVNGWLIAIILGALMLLAAAAGTYGLGNGYFDALLPQETATSTPVPSSSPTPVPTPAPTVDVGGVTWLNNYAAFPDSRQERALRRAIGQSEGEVLMSDLLTVEELYFCGNMVTKDDSAYVRDADGTYRVNGAPVARGGICDLTLIAKLLELRELALVAESITDASPLGSLARLRTFNLADNPITSVGGLSGMASLETLNIEHTSVRDLTPLSQLPSLRTVTVSSDMFPALKLDFQARYEVILVP